MKQRNKKIKALVCLLFCLTLLFTLFLPAEAVNTEKGKEVYIGGMLFGAKMVTDGVPIVSIDGVETDGGIKAPAHDAGLKVRDIIKKVNGDTVKNAEEITEKISGCGGSAINITVLRGGREKSVTLTPVKAKDGLYRAGIWIRDSAAGIGTVTYIEPETLEFGGLGHGICDGETMSLLPLLRGSISEVELIGIVKGKSGAPGEVKGAFKGGKIGALTKNTPCGVYGIYSTLPEGVGEKLPVAKESEIVEGEAEIRCSVSGSPEYYKVKISKMKNGAEGGKNFTVSVTDGRLLSITGGIVQGMSGSPIVQSGKLIGAVTHVLINDPTSGYGIFIGNML